MEQLFLSFPLPNLIILLIGAFLLIYFFDMLFLSREKTFSSAFVSVLPFVISGLMYLLFTVVAGFNKATSCGYFLFFFIVLFYLFYKTDTITCNIVKGE